MPEDNRSRRPQDEWQREFAASLRKATEQLAVGIGHEAAEWATQFAHDMQERQRAKWTEIQERKLQHIRAKASRKAARKLARRQARLGGTNIVEGYAFAVVASVLAVMAVVHPATWWLIFIALGLGIRGAQVIGFHRSRRPPPSPKAVPAKPQLDERYTRINELCDRLKLALKDAPPVVRDFLTRPEETVEALRKTSLDLLKREISLRTLVNPAQTERLSRERVTLHLRIESEADEVVRQRLTAALAALDHQRTQHAEVLKSANRLEAERTRLGYTLEGLYAQVMRLKTADAGSSELNAGLRTSLDQLRDEMSALAEAVEQVNRTPASFEPPAEFETRGSGQRHGSIDKV